MQHKSFATMECPAARALDLVGEWWSMLILRDAFLGVARFEQFQERLGIARNILARRLRVLVEAGLLDRVRYCERPVRYEYRLTAKGGDFFPVLVALLDCGLRWTPDGTAVRLVDSDSGAPVEPVLVDRRTGREITPLSLALMRPDGRRVGLRAAPTADVPVDNRDDGGAVP